MPYDIKWLVDKQVLYERMWGEIDAATIQTTSEIIARLMDESQAPPVSVHLLVDIREATKLPRSLSEINGLNARMPHMKHPALGWSVLLTNNLVYRFLASVLSQFSKTRFTAVETVDQALHFIKQRDERLNIPADYDKAS